MAAVIARRLTAGERLRAGTRSASGEPAGNVCQESIDLDPERQRRSGGAHGLRAAAQQASRTGNGTPVAVILAVADDESLVETSGTLPDPTAMAESGEAEEQMGNDEVHGEAELRCSRGPPRAGSPRTRVESASRCAAPGGTGRCARPAPL